MVMLNNVEQSKIKGKKQETFSALFLSCLAFPPKFGWKMLINRVTRFKLKNKGDYSQTTQFNASLFVYDDGLRL